VPGSVANDETDDPDVPCKAAAAHYLSRQSLGRYETLKRSSLSLAGGSLCVGREKGRPAKTARYEMLGDCLLKTGTGSVTDHMLFR
jgi:hypothetical protein